MDQAYSTESTILISLLEQIEIPRHIVLCVSGSIAAYKSLELASLLKKLGAQVAVVMSENALKFISPLSFEAITHIQVLHQANEDWSIYSSKEGLDPQAKSDKIDYSTHTIPQACNHIAYAQWADVCILAPATANTIAKLAYGIADTLIIQTLLATSAPILCAPAMNTQMLHAKQTTTNLATLASQGVQIIEPKCAHLACGTIGAGALADISQMIFALLKASKRDGFWQGREVCITGGGSSTMLDSVRTITNCSSGLQASTLAIALYTLGAHVTLISSSFPIPLPTEIRTLQVQTNEEYRQAILQVAHQRNVYKSHSAHPRVVLFMVAALADFTPQKQAAHKIKKSHTPQLHITLESTQDILTHLSSSTFIKIGFKAEDTLETGLPNAKAMLLSIEQGGKDCEIVCLNTLESAPFGTTHNRFTLLNRQSLVDSSAIAHLPHSTKLALSYEIAHFVKTSLEST